MTARVAAVFLVLGSSYAGSEDAPAAAGIAAESLNVARRALDLRVMGMNAMKNADAARGLKHEQLVDALNKGDADLIDNAREGHEKATANLEDVIKQVKKIVEFSMDAESLARQAELICKKAPESALKQCKPLLDGAEKALAKADKIASKLRERWLEVNLSVQPSVPTTTTTMFDSAAGT